MKNKRKLKLEVFESSHEDDNAAAPPLVAHFPAGLPGPQEDAVTSVYRNRKWNRASQFVAVRQQATVDYIGRTFGPENEYYQPCSFVVGVYNKTKQHIRVFPIAGNRLCRMEPRVHKLDYGKSLEITKIEGASTLEGTRRLLQTFGSAAAKRRVRNGQRNIIDVATVQGGDVLTDLLGESSRAAMESGKTREQMLAAAAYGTSLPPHDLDASTGESAYPFDGLCSKHLWESLNGELFVEAASDANAREKLETEKAPRYVLERLSLLQGSNSEMKKRKALQMAFLSALLKLYEAPNVLQIRQDSSGLRDLGETRAIDKYLLEYLLDLFYESRIMNGMRRYQRPESKLNLQMLYILVVALLIEDCRLGVEQFDHLVRDLKTKLSTLIGLFKHLGCSLQSHPRVGQPGYSVTLLEGKSEKTLRESLSPVKIGRKHR